MSEGTLPSQYVEERRSGGLTGLSGLAIYWERQHPAGGGWGVETPSSKPRSCRQDGGAPESRPCCPIAHGSASILLTVGVGVETPSSKPTLCRQDRGAPGSRPCCPIAHGSASILLAVVGGWRRRPASQGPAPKMAALPVVVHAARSPLGAPASCWPWEVGWRRRLASQGPAPKMAALPRVVRAA